MSESPAFLALTWTAWWIASVGLGWLILGRRTRNVGVLGWFGLFGVTAVSMVLALVLPLGVPPSRGVALLVIVGGLVAYAWARLWLRWRLLLAGIVIAVLVAFLSSVAPSNYDLGLYHAGSIAYVREGGTVIGLANLHDRFGFSSSMWPLSAFLGLGLWDGGEFRLVNGLLLILLSADVLVRVRNGRAREPGTILLSAGALLLIGAVIQYPGRLIASSAQDWAVAVLVVVSAAYLLDALTNPLRRHAATLAILTGAMAGAMRPTGWIYAVATVFVLASFYARRTGVRAGVRILLPGLAGSLVVGAATAVRDVLTSGWLLFPASVAPLPVAWRYPDPSGTAQDITAWARTPFQDPARTLADSSWIGGWLSRLPTDWAAFTALVLFVTLAVWIISSSTARASLVRRRGTVVAALVPSTLVLVAWFIIAPDPRFAWGPALLMVLVPLAFLVPTIESPWIWPSVVALGSVAIIAVAMVRGSLFDVSVDLQPMPVTEVKSSSLADGTAALIPVNGDQCWGEFPMCRPWYSSPDVQLRGDTWHSGFQPMSRLSDSQE